MAHHRFGIVIRAVLAAAALLGLTACGSDEIDRDALLEDIPAAALPAHPELIADVECPSAISLDGPGRIECTGSLDGDPVTFGVRATDDEADDDVIVSVDETLLDTADLVRAVGLELDTELRTDVSVTCDVAPVVVATEGRVIDCVASGARERPFRVRLLDGDGTYAIDLG